MNFLNYSEKRDYQNLLQKITKTGIIETAEEELAYFRATREPRDLLCEWMMEWPEMFYEMALAGSDVLGTGEKMYEVRKTPYLFNKEDIYYLWQFPPKFWAQALSHRYNQMIYEVHREAEVAKQQGRQPHVGDWDFITVYDGGHPYTFFVNTLALDHYKRLTNDVNAAYFTGSDPDIKNRRDYEEKYGYYGQTLGEYKPGGEVKEKAEEKDASIDPLSDVPNPMQRYEPNQKYFDREIKKKQGAKAIENTMPPDRTWLFRGLVGMSRARASVRLGSWMKDLADGWLAGKEGSRTRKNFDNGIKIEWQSILGTGGKERIRPIVVPCWDVDKLKQIDDVDNQNMLEGLAEIQPSYLFPKNPNEGWSEDNPNPHPEWQLKFSRNAEDIYERIKYFEMLDGPFAVLKDGELVKEKVPCRVWKGLTRNGIPQTFIAPLPILYRGLLVENNVYRQHENKMAAVDAMRIILNKKNTETANKKKKEYLADLKKDPNAIMTDIAKLQNKINENPQDEEGNEVSQDKVDVLNGILSVIHHLDNPRPGEPPRPDWRNEPIEKIGEYLKSYIGVVEKEARTIVNDAVVKGFTADEHDFVHYTYGVGPNMYHWVPAGGAEMNKGTKQVLHAPTPEIQDAWTGPEGHEQNFAGIQHDVDTPLDKKATDFPGVKRYAFGRTDEFGDLANYMFEEELRKLKDNLIKQQKIRDTIYKVLAEKPAPDNPRKDKKRSILEIINDDPWLPLDQMVDDDGNKFTRLHRVPGKPTGEDEKITWDKKVLAYYGKIGLPNNNGGKPLEGQGVYDLIKTYTRALSSVQKIERRLAELNAEREKGFSGFGPIHDGINDFMDVIEGTPEHDVLLIGKKMLFDSIRMYIRRNLGDRYYIQFLKAEEDFKEAKEKFDTDPKTENSFKTARKRLIDAINKWKVRIRTLAYNYTKCMWQLDLGFGTRRQRERDEKRTMRGMRPAWIKPELNRGMDEMTPNDKKIAAQMKKHLEDMKGAMPAGFELDDFIREIKTGIEGREEIKGTGTATGIEPMRNYLLKQIRGVSDRDTNIKQLMAFAQRKPEDFDTDQDEGQTPEKGAEDLGDFAYGMSTNDLLTWALLRKGGQAANLLRIGFIEYEKLTKGREPTEEEVGKYMDEVFSKLKSQVGDVLYEKKKTLKDDESGEAETILGGELDVEKGHPIEKVRKYKGARLNKSQQAKRSIIGYADNKIRQYQLNNEDFGAVDDLWKFVFESERILGTRSGNVNAEEFNPIFKDKFHLSKSDLPIDEMRKIIDYYKSFVNGVPHFNETRMVILALKSADAYKVVPVEDIWEKAERTQNYHAARNWINADAILNTHTLIIRGVKWVVPVEDLRGIKQARAYWGTRAASLVTALKKRKFAAERKPKPAPQPVVSPQVQEPPSKTGTLDF